MVTPICVTKTIAAYRQPELFSIFCILAVDAVSLQWHTSDIQTQGHAMTEHEQLEFAMNQIMMALGIIADLADWYACADEMV